MLERRPRHNISENNDLNLVGLEETFKKPESYVEQKEQLTNKEIKQLMDTVLATTSSEAEAKKAIRRTLTNQGVNVDLISVMYIKGQEDIIASAMIDIVGKDNNKTELKTKIHKPVH